MLASLLLNQHSSFHSVDGKLDTRRGSRFIWVTMQVTHRTEIKSKRSVYDPFFNQAHSLLFQDSVTLFTCSLFYSGTYTIHNRLVFKRAEGCQTPSIDVSYQPITGQIISPGEWRDKTRIIGNWFQLACLFCKL